MNSKSLVDTNWLEQNLKNDDIRIFDCTVHISADSKSGIKFKSGIDNYKKKHIIGAGFLDVLIELSDKDSNFDVTLPSPDQFSEVVSRKGVSNSSTVVLYSTEGIQWATRVWWMFKVFGLDNVKILDGGGQKWFAENRPISESPSYYPEGVYTPKLRQELLVNKDEVQAAIDDNEICTINSLSNPMYTGKSPLNFGRKGHIPESVNLWFMDLINSETNEFLPIEKIKERFNLIGAFDKPKCITYCGKGLAASANAFALHLLGHDQVALYDGSMNEWALDSSLPLVEG